MTRLAYSTKLDEHANNSCGRDCCKEFKKSCKIEESKILGTVTVHRYSPCNCKQCNDKIFNLNGE